jgi:cellulose synthase/poly-beta-1,6-N-acetylglucosamine synthase-like glycosyltransferase
MPNAVMAVSIVYLLVCIPYALRTYGFIILALRYGGAGPGSHSASLVDGRHAVSVIIPCRNEDKVIATTIRAALAQALPPYVDRYEIIAVDDGSTDRTGAILDELAGEFTHVRVIHRRTAHGKAAALNEGVRRAVGDLIVFIDADHELAVDAVDRLVTPLAAGTAEVVQGRCVVRNGGVNLLTRLIGIDNTVSYTIDLTARTLIGTCPITGSTMACARGVFDRVGLFTEDRLGEDTDMSLRFMRHNIRVQYVADAISTDLAPSTVRGYIRQRRRWANSHNTVLFAWLRSSGLGSFLDFRGGRFEVLLYLFIYIVPVLGFIAALSVGLQVAFRLPALVGPWHSAVALWLAAAYPAQLVVAAFIRRTYADILFIPVYVVRSPVESVAAVLGLIDCLRKEHTWYQAERPVFHEIL